jgi:lipid-A-disaccharide synthase
VKPRSILLIAGDPSGDLLGAELAQALREQAGPFPPRLWGAGGPAMAAAGVELRHDLTRHSVIGLEILRRYAELRGAFQDLLDHAMRERPDIVVGVDYGGFNLRFAAALRARVARERGPFLNWRPQLVQYVSPQVWASRPGRVKTLARTQDLLLSILPFEPAWYAARAPNLRVEFVGHPIVDRHGQEPVVAPDPDPPATLLLLPGSRVGEVQRHLPVMIPAAEHVAAATGARVRMVLPQESLRAIAAPFTAALPGLEVQIGGLAAALRGATVALASTGTVTLECAWFGVPTVALYRTSWLTYEVGRRLITVKYLAMPNLLAGEAVMPEFVQAAATPEALAAVALEWFRSPERRAETRAQLARVAKSLGPPGAGRRAAAAILSAPAATSGPANRTIPNR